MDPPLLAVPNVSEGRDEARIATLRSAFSDGVALLDRHTDIDHNRTVFTLAGPPGALRDALARGAAAAVREIDMSAHGGLHPAIGALDVCPVVWPAAADRDRAVALAGEVAAAIADLGVPVFLYGVLAAGEERIERAHFRDGGPELVRVRMEGGELRPDAGPSRPHPTAGTTLVTARPPLGAFNVELDTEDVEIARRVAASLRESGRGLPGVRAIGLPIGGPRVQVSTNIHDPLAVTLGTVVDRVRELAAPLGARPVEAELVGLIPAAAVEGYPADVPIRGFDPARHTIEARLADLA